jgi:hypothetical protein
MGIVAILSKGQVEKSLGVGNIECVNYIIVILFPVTDYRII